MVGVDAPVIEASALRKVYPGRIVALDGIDLAVRPGEVFGLLGANGAGKTTAVKILLGLTHPTSGSARLMGLPVGEPESRRRVGYLPEGHRFPGHLTARETLSIFGRMSGLDPRAAAVRGPQLLTRLRIADRADTKVKKFSKGMTQRLGLAAALVHDPELLLLDEPTDGVDPVGRREIRDLLKEEAGKGRAILLNSHLLSEVELVCDRVAVLRKGKVVACGTIAELTASAGCTYKLRADGVDEALLASLRETGAGVTAQNGHFVLNARDLDHLNAVVDRLRASGGTLVELSPLRSTLEDVFVDLVRAGGEEKVS